MLAARKWNMETLRKLTGSLASQLDTGTGRAVGTHDAATQPD